MTNQTDNDRIEGALAALAVAMLGLTIGASMRVHRRRRRQRRPPATPTTTSTPTEAPMSTPVKFRNAVDAIKSPKRGDLWDRADDLVVVTSDADDTGYFTLDTADDDPRLRSDEAPDATDPARHGDHPMTTPAITDELRTALNTRQSALLAYEGSRREVRAALERYLRTLAPEEVTIDVRIDDADRDAVRVTATVAILGQTTSPPWYVQVDHKTGKVEFVEETRRSGRRGGWAGRVKILEAEKAIARLVAAGKLEPVTGAAVGRNDAGVGVVSVDAAIAAATRAENLRCQHVARGCLDYLGGYTDPDDAVLLTAFRHGINTVFRALEAIPEDSQTRALETVGAADEAAERAAWNANVVTPVPVGTLEQP